MGLPFFSLAKVLKHESGLRCATERTPKPICIFLSCALCGEKGFFVAVVVTALYRSADVTMMRARMRKRDPSCK